MYYVLDRKFNGSDAINSGRSREERGKMEGGKVIRFVGRRREEG